MLQDQRSYRDLMSWIKNFNFNNNVISTFLTWYNLNTTNLLVISINTIYYGKKVPTRTNTFTCKAPYTIAFWDFSLITSPERCGDPCNWTLFPCDLRRLGRSRSLWRGFERKIYYRVGVIENVYSQWQRRCQFNQSHMCEEPSY